MPDRYLTKSLFLNYRPCARRFWYMVHEPSLFPVPTEAERLRMEAGKTVDRMAQALFPGGVNAYRMGETEEEAARTQELIASGADILFQPTFIADRLMVRCDILRRLEGGGWELIEVKSSLSFRRDHEPDLGFQWLVLQRAGLDIRRASFIHVNGGMIFGPETGAEQFLVMKDATGPAKKMAQKLAPEVDEAVAVMERVEPMMQDLMPFCKACAVVDSHCHPERSPADVIFLPRIRVEKVIKLRSEGIYEINQAAERDVTGQQRLVWLAMQQGGVHSEPTLKDELARVVFPAAFIDFEAANPIIPIYPGVRPGQQVPFQWSCHTAFAPDKLSADDLRHDEFLEQWPIDPREGFAASLWEAVKDANSIVYYSSFEPARLKELRDEGIPYGRELYEKISGHQGVDLYQALADTTYLEGFGYSWSIKTVLPALLNRYLPEMEEEFSYKNLEIKNGEEAVLQYLRMVQAGTTEDEKNRIAENLKRYCGLDSFAMVKVYEALLRLVG